MAILRQPWRWMPFGFRLLLARLRSRASQYRLLRRSAIVGAVAITLVVLAAARVQSMDAREKWGETIEVLVVSGELAPGESFDGRIELVARPVALVPADALQAAFEDVEHAARALKPGDIVTTRDLTSSGHAIRLDTDQRAVSLPLGPGVPLVNIGDQIELYVVFDSFGDVTETPERIDSAIVVARTDDDLTIAVDEADVAMLAQASTSGQVIVARR